MNELRKAAEMALKVLEEINKISKPPIGIPLPAEIDNAMETLRQALTQPQREWVGFTQEEIKDLIRSFDWRAPVEHFVASLEARLKDKNQPQEKENV